MIPSKQSIKTSKLSNQEFRNIRNLVQEAAKVDKFQTRFYWNIMKNRQLPEFDDFLYYVEGKLVGYLALFLFKDGKAELSAIIHPKFRRKKIFTHLLEEAALELRRKHIPKTEFICHTKASILLGIAKKYQAEYQHSECEMHLEKKPNLDNLPEITIRLAAEEDINTLADIDSACFHTNIQRMRQRFVENLKEKHRRTWIISSEGKDIGKAHIRFEDEDTAFIHDLGVLPQYQRKGYASAMVMLLREELKKLGFHQITLDVLKDNEAAIKLYERCGFKLTAEHQFWLMETASLLKRPCT